MRRCLAIVAVGFVGLGLVWVGGKLSGPSAFAKARENLPEAPGLEAKLSGGWFVLGQEPGGPIEVLMTLDPGGSFTINCTPTPFGTINTTGMGSWKPTGPRSFVGTFICFQRDYTGQTQYYEKATIWMDLGDHGTRLEGYGIIYIYLQGQDPLVDDPIAEIEVPLEARRIPAE